MHLFNHGRLRLLITDSCNLSCSYCHNEGQFGHGAFMPLFEVQQLADWLISNDVEVKNLIISGGEPTLHPQLLDIVHVLKSSASKVSMVTNGTRIGHQKIDQLASAGMTYMKFGIDAVDSATTKGPLDRPTRSLKEQVLETAIYANAVMPGSHLNTVVSSFNSNRIRSMLAWCDEHRIGAKFLELIEVRPELRRVNPFPGSKGHSWFSRLYRDVADLLTDVEYSPSVMKFYAKTPGGQTIQFSEDFCIYGACSQLWTRIDSHRRLVPCIHRPVTQDLTLSEEGLAQTAAVNRQMTESSLWPCGISGPAPAKSADDEQFLDLQVSENEIKRIPLTTRTGCLG